MFHECLFKHCFICGDHDAASGNYCPKCMTERYEEVKKDAEIRGLSGDNRDRRFWAFGHDFPNGTCGHINENSYLPGVCLKESGHEGMHLHG